MSAANRSRIARNLQTALHARLRGTPSEVLGQDAGVATVGDAVRFPDALVTCTRGPGSARWVPGVLVVFEILSPRSGRTDRIEKIREYWAVPSIRRYVILEQTSIGLTVFAREASDAAWIATTLTDGETLRMPQIGVEIPVAEFYEGIEAGAPETSSGRGSVMRNEYAFSIDGAGLNDVACAQ